MNLTITLSEALSQRLLAHAEQIEMTASQLAEAWLANMLREAEQRKQAQLELEGVVKRAKALPPLQPSQVHPATASLRDLLAQSILENDNNNEAEFDLEGWNEQWDAIEAEDKALMQRDEARERERLRGYALQG